MRELEKIVWKQTEDNRWLAYDENETQITGWLHDLSRDTWYYCCSDNIQTNWLKDTDERWYYFFTEQCVDYGKQYYKGEMKTGWLNDNGKWYYLIPYSYPSLGIYKGQMLLNTTEEINGIEYTFDETGTWKENTGEVSDKLATFTGSWEGFYDHAYADPYYGEEIVSYFTIGFGTCYCSIPEAFPDGLNSTCTREQALQWLKQEETNCYKAIESNLKNKGIILKQHQIDALADFAYNCGTGALFGSTLYRYITNGGNDAETIKSYFRMWNKANGQVSVGLDKRRISEANLYNYGDYTGNN